MKFLLFLLHGLLCLLSPVPKAHAQSLFPPVVQAFQMKNSSTQAIYTDKLRHFTLQYPKKLHPNVDNHYMQTPVGSQFFLSFIDDSEYGYFSLDIQKTSFASLSAWLNSANIKLPQVAKITVKKDQIRSGVRFLTLNVPVDVDQDAQGQTIYANQKRVVFLKSGELYTFTLREQLEELPEVETDFDNVVKSFHFFSPYHLQKVLPSSGKILHKRMRSISHL